MKKAELEAIVYDTLKIPHNVKDSTLIQFGEITPVDNFSVIEELTKHRIRSTEIAKKIAQTKGLDYTFTTELQKRSYHTYKDFLLQAKHQEHTRKDITEGRLRYGNSAFRPASNEEAYLAYVQDKDPELAQFFFTKLAAQFAERDRLRHTLVLGKSGFGKSELLKQFVYQYYRQKKGYCTAIVVDPHGDLAEEIAQLKEFKNSDDIVYIDPFADPTKNWFPTLNVFDTDETDMSELDSRAQAVNNAFKSIIGTEFSDSMRALLPPCYWVLFLRPNSTMEDLIRFMDDDRNTDLIEFGKKLPYKMHREFFRSQFSNKDNSRTKVALAKKFQILMNSPNFYDCLCKSKKSSYSIRELLNSRKVVVFALPTGKLGEDTTKVLGSFLVAMITHEIFKRAYLDKSTRIPVHAYIDEFQTFIGDDPRYLEKILSQARKYGLHLTLAQQFLGQDSSAQFVSCLANNTAVQVVGFSSEFKDTNAKLIGVKSNKIAQLKTGEFYFKIGANPVFKLHASDALVRDFHPNRYMSFDEWHSVKQHLFEHYYSYVGKDPATASRKSIKPTEQEHAPDDIDVTFLNTGNVDDLPDDYIENLKKRDALPPEEVHIGERNKPVIPMDDL